MQFCERRAVVSSGFADIGEIAGGRFSERRERSEKRKPPASRPAPKPSASYPLTGFIGALRARRSWRTKPAAQSGGFDIYADGGTLTYIKEDGEEDARGRFALFAFPVDQNDPSQTARDAGLEYEPLDFDLHDYGARIDGGRVAVRNLSCAISHVETGQVMPGERRLWSAETAVGE